MADINDPLNSVESTGVDPLIESSPNLPPNTADSLTDEEAKEFLAAAPKQKVFSRKTLKSEYVPYQSLDEAVKSGSHFYPKGTTAFVKDVDTEETYEVPSENLQKLLTNTNSRLESPKETAIREYLNKPENKGLSGASKVAIQSALNEFSFGVSGVIDENTADPLDLDQRKALAEKYKIADYGGMALGLTGAVGLTGGLNLGAKGLRAASKLLSKEVTQKTGEIVTEKAAQGIMKSALTKGAEFGVEGLAYSTPRAITEAAFGNPDDAAMTLLAGGALGSVFGAGWGGGAATFKKGKELASSYINNAERQKAMAYKLLGANSEQVTKLQKINPELDSNVANYVGEIASVNPKTLNSPKEFADAVQQKTAAAASRIDEIAFKVDQRVDGVLKVADDPTRASLEAAFPDLKKLVTSVDDEILKPLRINADDITSKYVTGTEKEAAQLEKYLNDFIGDAQLKYGSTQPTTLKGLTDLKRNVNRLIKDTNGKKESILNDGLKSLQAKINTSIKTEIAPAIERGFPDFRGLADDLIKADLDFSMGSAFGRSAQKLSNKEMLGKVSDRLLDSNDLLFTSIVGIKGKAIQELFKYTKGKLQNEMMLNINKGLQQQAKAIDSIPKVLKKEIGIDKFIPYRAGQETRGVFKDIFGIDDADNKKSLNNEELYQKISDKVSTLYASPEATAEQVAQIANPFSELGAPLIAASINGYMLNTAKYISDMLPKPIQPLNPIFKQKAYTPSDRDMYKFARKLEVVNDPMVLIQNLQNGTLSQDEVQVVQDLYPAMLNKIRSKVVDFLAESETVIPYADRLKYALILGIDADLSTQGPIIAQLQQTYVTYLNNPPFNETVQNRPSKVYTPENLETQVGRITRTT